ncbi:MAG: hypothetical protein ACSHYF_01005 [Verrucomicrobiaceae bacterium]
MSRLPIGATLSGVSIPRFDEQKRRASLLTAKVMVVESAAQLKGEDLVLRVFDRDQQISGTASMDFATYLVEKEQIVADGELLIKSTKDEFIARGQGGILTLNSRQGLLLGPAATMFLNPDKKRQAMNSPKTLLPFLAGIQLLVAAPPVAIPVEELIEFERQAAPRIVPPFESSRAMAAAAKKEQDLLTRLTAFLGAIGQSQLLSQQEAAPDVAEPAIPFEDLFIPNKDRIVIEASRGIYFDGENQEVVYMGRISLKGKGMTMTCTDGMKALFDPPKEEAKPKEDDNADDNPFGGFKGLGELSQFSANGNIEIKGKGKKGEPILVRGERAVYDAKKEQLIIRGDALSLRLGGAGARSKDKNAYLVIKLLGGNNISAQTEGNWLFGLPGKLNR